MPENLPLLNQQLLSQARKTGPIRIIQFGEGVFLRGFVDWLFEKLRQKNLFDGSIAVVQPIAQGRISQLGSQDGLYTLRLRGIENGRMHDEEEIITAIHQWLNPYENFRGYLQMAENPDLGYIISNTTEAGISWLDGCRLEDQPAQSYPAKLTQLLYHRFKHFGAAAKSGLKIIPCELIDRNGDHLRQLVLRHAAQWQLPAVFSQWLEQDCLFYNTLVDRIVTGFPAEDADEICRRLGYNDRLYNTAEYFHLWVIEGPADPDLPFAQAGLNVLFTDDLTRYRERKVRILNGTHTLIFAVALLCHLETVRQTLEDPDLPTFAEQALAQAIIPYVPIEQNESRQYADSVIERFLNPHLQHQWAAISLNAVSQFKVRVLPSLMDAIAAGKSIPIHLAFSLAALILLYRGDHFVPRDDADICQIFSQAWHIYNQNPGPAALKQLVRSILQHKQLWGQDLTSLTGLNDLVTSQLDLQMQLGMRKAVQKLVR